MAKDRNDDANITPDDLNQPISRHSDGDHKKKRSRHSRSRSPRRHHHKRRHESSSDSDEYSSSSSSDHSSDSEDSGSESAGESGSEEREGRRRRREKQRRRKEKEDEERRKRRKEKERRRRKREEKEEERRRKKKKAKAKKEAKKDSAKKGAVTNSWGKFGIIRETDMWNKRPEFTAWLAEVKKVNLEALQNWEEKQMFKEFMEDHNTATFPSKKYYDLDAYHRRQIEKEIKLGKKVQQTERTVFDDEEQRRIELMKERERRKEEEVEALKRSMQGGMAQAMKEQTRLREEMMYQYKLGNFEAAAAIQKRLDPDADM